MIKVTDKQNCCGCTACKSICPRHCISMKEDNEGFLYPKVDISSCIDCKLCEKVCPVLSPLSGSEVMQTLTIAAKNKEDLIESASGGSFMPLAEYVIDNGGVVFGAAYDYKMRLKHQYTESKREIKRFRGSKYVQSDLGNTFLQVKYFLNNGKLVLFSGTPCQIQGLYKYLAKKNTSNLITLDFVCHGVPSPKVFRKYIDYIETTNKSSVIDYKFRTKKLGYNYKCFDSCCYELSNGIYIYSNDNCKYDLFMTKCFFAEIASRPSCGKCVFKSKNHISDFTVFDCWHWKQLSKNVDGRMGATTMIVNTSKGKEIYNNIDNKFYSENSNLDNAIKLDGISMIYSPPVNNRRGDFFKQLDNMTIPQLYDEFLKMDTYAQIKQIVKNFLRSLNLLPIIWNIKYKFKNKK